jgi:hypothetical protein
LCIDSHLVATIRFPLWARQQGVLG